MFQFTVVVLLLQFTRPQCDFPQSLRERERRERETERERRRQREREREGEGGRERREREAERSRERKRGERGARERDREREEKEERERGQRREERETKENQGSLAGPTASGGRGLGHGTPLGALAGSRQPRRAAARARGASASEDRTAE